MNNVFTFFLHYFIHRNIPYIGHYIHEPLRDYLQQQKNSLHRGTNQMLETKVCWILFLVFRVLLFSYFIFACFVLGPIMDLYNI